MHARSLAVLTLTFALGCEGNGARTTAGRDRPPGTAPPASVAPGGTAAPNLVVLLLDDTPFQLFGDGDARRYVPKTYAHVADSGVRFERGYVNVSLCCPSRASILTGLYQRHHQVLNNSQLVGGFTNFADKATIATALRGAGYVTALMGKYLNGYRNEKVSGWPYVPPGWDEWRGAPDSSKEGGSPRNDYYEYTLVEKAFDSTAVAENHFGSKPADYVTGVLTRRAVDFIRRVPASRPLFLYLSYIATHGPYTPAPQDRGACASLPPWRPPSFNEENVGDQPGYVRKLPKLRPHQASRAAADRRGMCETLRAVDRSVDSLFAALANTGRLANTYVVVVSDNGYHFGEHRLVHRKATLFEETTHVGFMVRGPRVPVRADDDHFVQLSDIAPTLLEWAGVPRALTVDGVSLATMLTTPSTPWRTELLLEQLDPTKPLEKSEGLRDAKWSYHEFRNGDRALYDMTEDPYQQTNLATAPSQAATVAKLAARLAALRTP
jgi:arylsulfatase A-like enzyme